MTGYLIAAAIFSVLFYAVNIFFVSADLVKNLNRIAGNADYNFAGSEQLSPEQIRWINDPALCSACGARPEIFDLYCPDCGLKFKQNRYSIPLNTSKYKDVTVKYHYVEKQETKTEENKRTK